MEQVKNSISSSQIIILGFAAVILAGSFLLMIPLATKDGKGADFLDAVFTATSAVCVTGLVVKDTATYWSGFGQGVILLLIQIGGMGVVTIALTVSMFSGKRVTLKQRSTMQEAISAHHVGGIVKMTGFFVKTALILELVGAMVMAPVFCKEFGLGQGLWYSIFHSISAFCNAGFDLMGVRNAYSSLTHYVAHPVINLTIMLLIIIGGIGFLTWEDVKNHRWRIHRYRMQSKVILLSTGLLILVPFLYFLFFEFNDYGAKERIWGALFQSVTPRTAGFNTMDLTGISEVGLLILIFLMLIGGSPGSTAGGMKTTTFAVLLSTAGSVFCRKEHTNFFGRRVEEDAVRRAVTIGMMYLILFLIGGCLISRIDQLPLLTCLFETASAIGTVGLTLGITPELQTASQLILIILMYIGRVGGLTLIYSALNKKGYSATKLPQEKMIVG